MNKYVISQEELQTIVNGLVELPFVKAAPILQMMDRLPTAVIHNEISEQKEVIDIVPEHSNP